MSAYDEIKNKDIVTDLDLAVIFYGMDDPEDEDGNAAAQELIDLRARLAQAEELLKRNEWSLENDWGSHCIECSKHQSFGHLPDCELAAFLKGVK